MSNHVPIALIRQVCYPTSYRLPKLVRLDFKQPSAASAHVVHFPVHQSTSTTADFEWAKKAFNAGNLPHGDYRFFVGRLDKHNGSGVCRWCRDILYTEKARKEHKGNRCQEKLTRLYRTLLDARHCAVCNRLTHSEHWGIPLCIDSCRNEWKFTLSPQFKMAVDKRKVVLGEVIKP